MKETARGISAAEQKQRQQPQGSDQVAYEMDLSSQSVTQILNQKIAEIQARLPIQMSIPGNGTSEFADLLASASAGTAAASGVAQAGTASGSSAMAENGSDGGMAAAVAALLGSSAASGSADSTFQSNSSYGTSYGATQYPVLNASQLQSLMPRINAAIDSSAAEYGLDPALLRAMIDNESAWQPFATSRSGAMGLMQLMPGTADDLGVEDPYGIEENIRGGAAYMREQLDAFGGDLQLALAAYNAGPNAVRSSGGVPDYESTRSYIRNVMGSMADYQAD